MKLKGLTKLALSGVALAAVAATLGTSTYAWYVANSTASVDGLSGATASSNSGNLLLAQLTYTAADDKLTEAAQWGNKLSSVTVKSNNTLNPVSKDTDAIKPTAATDAEHYANPSNWHDRDLKVVPAANAYNYYAFGIMSTEKSTVDMKFGIDNTTGQEGAGTFAPQTCYNTAGVSTGNGSVAVNDSFVVDLVSALRIEVFQAPLTTTDAEENVVNATLAGVGAAANSKAFTSTANFFNGALNGAYAGITAPSGVKTLTNGNAHSYYQAVAGEAPKAGITEVAGTDLTGGVLTLTLTPKQKTVLLVRVWIEGTDTDCFDSVGGQSYQINLGFTAR